MSQDQYQLVRVIQPSKAQIGKEKSDKFYRDLRRYGIKLGTTTGILVAMYIAYHASICLKDVNKRVVKLEKNTVVVPNAPTVEIPNLGISASGAVVAPSPSTVPYLLQPVAWVASGASSFIKDTGKCVIETLPTLVTGMILTTLWQSTVQRIIDASKQESIGWYIEQHTQLWSVLGDLKLSCIPYDLHSELLSMQQLYDKSGVQAAGLLKDLSVLESNKQDEIYDAGYAEHCRKSLVKNYGKKSDELERLQAYAVAHIAQKKRIVAQGLQGAHLFETEHMSKQQIVDLCTLLSQNIQKLLAFAMLPIDHTRFGVSQETINRGKAKITYMITITNQYLERMEQLLNMDLQKLESMSMSNQGLFTCTYEFEKLLQEHINGLQRYSLLIK